AIDSHRAERGIHQRERFLFSMFSFAQAKHRRVIARISDELKSAETFQRENSPPLYDVNGLTQRVVARRQSCAVFITQPQLWAALWASIRLRVKTTVEWLFIFPFAFSAHDEFSHRRVRAIVRQRFND